jgi:hypothetical protein
LQDAAARERPVEPKLEWEIRLALRALERLLGGLLRLLGRGCFDGGANGVAGRLSGGELALLDAGEERDEEHQREQHAGEKEQPGDDPLPVPVSQPAGKPDHGAASACG